MTEYTTRDFQLVLGFNNQSIELRLMALRARVRYGLVHENLPDREYLRWFSPRQLAHYQYLRWARAKGLTT